MLIQSNNGQTTEHMNSHWNAAAKQDNSR